MVFGINPDRNLKMDTYDLKSNLEKFKEANTPTVEDIALEKTSEGVEIAREAWAISARIIREVVKAPAITEKEKSLRREIFLALFKRGLYGRLGETQAISDQTY